jgi:hypothetical protein
VQFVAHAFVTWIQGLKTFTESVLKMPAGSPGVRVLSSRSASGAVHSTWAVVTPALTVITQVFVKLSGPKPDCGLPPGNRVFPGMRVVAGPFGVPVGPEHTKTNPVGANEIAHTPASAEFRNCSAVNVTVDPFVIAFALF